MHLEVDPTILSDTASDLRRCVEVAREFADHRGHLTALIDECGSAPLREAAEHFIGRWGYGTGLLVDDAEHLAGRLEHAANEYRKLEADLSRQAT
jgi:hypothetical protein